MTILRKIIEIDESLCNGCGQCIRDCAEGALAIIDGKARVISDNLCDGLGACLQGCPQGALRIIEREAAAFDHAAVHARQHGATPLSPLTKGGLRNSAGNNSGERLACGCPGSAVQSLATDSGDKHWPVKLRLVPESAPFLRGADLLLVADCAPVVFPQFQEFARGKVICTLCPKFEDVPALMDKITRMAQTAHCKSVTTLRMEVPCCGPLTGVGASAADAAAGTQAHYCLSRHGALLPQA